MLNLKLPALFLNFKLIYRGLIIDLIFKMSTEVEKKILFDEKIKSIFEKKRRSKLLYNE